MLPWVAAMALPSRELENELAMNPCSGMGCALPCNVSYCNDPLPPYDSEGKSWSDKCLWDECEGCEPCAAITPPRAALLCKERDTWKPKFQPDNPRKACDHWATDVGSNFSKPESLKETCLTDTWAQQHCPFTCCLATKGITHPLPLKADEPPSSDIATGLSDPEASPSPSAVTSFSSTQPTTTIAIGFLTRGDLPLFSKVWGPFFSGCHDLAAVPIVHSQANPESDDGKAVRHALANRVERYGGALVPHDKTLYGDMRFSFNMVAGMFALARTASTHKAPNGRYPDWIHFASERCAPVRPCPALQNFLDANPGVNHLESSPSTSVGVQRIAQANVPVEFRPFVMSSQWATLWMKDVLKLTDDEDRLREKWGPRSHPAPIYGINVSPRVFVYGAPDEWLWHTELAQLNATVQSPGLTNVYWCYGCQHADNNDGASPAAYLDKASTIDGCTRAQNMGDFFGRKFGNANSYITPLVHQELVETGLLECHTRHIPPRAVAGARQFDVEFSRLTKQYPRTRAEARVQAGQPFWHGPGAGRRGFSGE